MYVLRGISPRAFSVCFTREICNVIPIFSVCCGIIHTGTIYGTCRNYKSSGSMTSGHLRSKEILWHNSMTGGFSSFLALIKDIQGGVIILPNSQNQVDNIGLDALRSLSSKTQKVELESDLVR